MTAAPGPEILPGELDEARRDVLAVLACRLADDEEGILAVWRNCNQVAFGPVALGLLSDLLDELGIDRAEWVRQHQAGLAGRLAGDDG